MFNPFKKLFSIFERSGESIVGIDIGSSYIKVVQIRQKGGRAILETYGNLALGPYAQMKIGQSTSLPVNKLSEALADVLREANITTKKCGLAIAISSSLVSVIEMPAVNPNELGEMVSIEARKYIPVPIGEVSLDWSLVPNFNNVDPSVGKVKAPLGAPTPIGKLEVLLVVIHNSAIERYKQLATGNSLESSFFEIEVFSVMRSSIPDIAEPIIIFDMGAATTKMYITERGVIRNSHMVNRGGQDITGAISRSIGKDFEEAEIMKRDLGSGVARETGEIKQVISASFNFIFSEAKRFISNFEQKYNKSVKTAVLVGGGANFKGLREIAENELKIPMAKADPFSRLSYPAFMEPVLKDIGPEFSVAIGVALRKLQEGE
jgi:type IV pilus assembly protein PilM